MLLLQRFSSGLATAELGPVPTKTAPSLDSLQYDGDALTDADAHGEERVASAGALQLARCGESKPGAGGPERMAHGDGPAVGIDAGVIEGQAKTLEAGQHLRRERLIDLDHIHVL